MFPWNKTERPPCHFRKYVSSKLSWERVEANVRFRPGTTHPVLRKQSIDDSTRAAFRDAARLFAIELYNWLRPSAASLGNLDEEVIVFECLVFCECFLYLSLNPEDDTYSLAKSVRNGLADEYELMSLLDRAELENVAETRFKIYEKSVEAQDHQAHLRDSFCRVLTYLAKGEHYSRVSIRHEDPPNGSFHLPVFEFADYANDVLSKLLHLIVSREIEEEST